MDAIQFTLSTILMLALGLVLYLTARSLPRITEDPNEDKKKSLVEAWIVSEMPHRIDQAMNTFMGKFFRKLKIYILRMDNILTERLKKMSSDQNGKPKIDFNEIVGERNGENGENSKLAEKR